MTDLWAVLLAALVCRPLLFGSGYGLARDMVFTPRQPLDLDALGLGSGSARAVPVNAVLGLSALVLDGTWVGRFAVFVVLVLAGCGAHRLLRPLGLPARLIAAGFAVWNPFVVERLALGQWALLSAYAALPWLVAAVLRYRADGAGHRRLAPVIGWLALAALTPTGAIIGAVATLVMGLGRSRRRNLTLIAVALVLQVPWILPSVLNAASATSDPAAVAAFAARPERPGGPLLSLLGLGGIWDSGSVPPSRSGALGYLTEAAVVVALVAGLPGLRRCLPRGRARLVGLAAFGFVLACASSVPGLSALERWAVATVPGAGLLRDSQKWLIPFVLLVVVCAAQGVQRLCLAAPRRFGVALAVAAAALPLLLLPDALATTRDALTPVRYPPDFQQVARRVDGTGALLTLPLSAYRRFAWGRPLAVADPAPQWFDTRVVVSDELVVGNTRLAGENPLVARIGHELAAGQPAAAVLSAAAIRWVLVYRDAPGAAQLPLAGLHRAYSGAHLALYRVDAPVARGRTDAAVVAVLLADGLVLCLVLAALLAAVADRLRRRSAA